MDKTTLRIVLLGAPHRGLHSKLNALFPHAAGRTIFGSVYLVISMTPQDLISARDLVAEAQPQHQHGKEPRLCAT